MEASRGWDPQRIPEGRAGTAHAAPGGCASRTGARCTSRSGETKLRKQALRCMDCGHPVLPQRVPAGQPHPEWNDPDPARGLAGRHRAPARHEQLPGVHRPAVPGAVRRACRVLGINQDPVTINRSRCRSSTRPGSTAGSRRSRRSACPGKTVAVVGSGPGRPWPPPSNWRRGGHTVAVYERADRAGGLLRYGIPEFKMEKRHLDRRRLAQMRPRVKFRTGIPKVGRTSAPTTCAAVTTRCCSRSARRIGRELPVPGREFAGIYQAMEYRRWPTGPGGDLEDSPIHAGASTWS